MFSRVCLSWVVAASLALAQAPTRLELKPGDHIAILGNALPDRMQHSGYFETLLHARFPQHKLVVRNLAAAGDEVVIRHRSENFGTPDDWLNRVKADIIVGFFGFNESFKGPDGLPGFKADLEKFIRETKAKNYSGKAAPRIVLVSPIANERHQDPNLPDPTANNANLADYTAAMAAVAKQEGVQFVDLFAPSQGLFAAAAQQKRSLTLNGIHLTEEGDRLLAPVLFEALVGGPLPTGSLDELRDAVNEKNWQWHQRYRTIDGYNVYGGRSALAYQPEKGGFISERQAPDPYVSNYKVMQQEMGQRDVMTANRDPRVWAVAQGGEYKVNDSNLPPVQKVESNKPGPNPDKSPVYLGGEAAIAKMTVHSHMKVNLFASEEQFPELINPLQMAWDTKGRLWVTVWRNYPERTPSSTVGDSVLIFEDTNGDGKADKVTHFLDDLNAPTGFQFYRDGIVVMQAPDFWFVRDTDGDGKADTKERLLMGLDSADSHHTANAICMDPGGAMYLSDGVFHRTQVETAIGPVRNEDAAIYRFEPATGRFERYIPYGFANPHGRVFDYWGNDIITDATGNANYFGAAFSGHLDYPAKHPGMREFWNRPSRPCPGTGILTSRHFPEEFQGNFLNLNVISFQGVYRVKVSEEGSGLKGETLENFISSSDPNFRPIAISTGPDGAVYFADWHQNIIGHMQHHLRDPNRGHEHGRIYRVTYEGRPLMTPVKIDGQPIAALLELLKEPENQTRELAKIELGKRNPAEVTAAAKAWSATLDKNDPRYEHHMMEALWVHQWHNVVDTDLLHRLLRSSDPRARAAAARVLCYWRDRVPDALAWFRVLASDEHPRVRLEAVRAASFFNTGEAADVALAILRQPMDYYLEYTLTETLRQLEPVWRAAIAAGQPIAADNPAGQQRLVGRLAPAELIKMPRTRGVLEAILTRDGISDIDRSPALIELAKLRNTRPVPLLLEMIQAKAGSDASAAGNLSRLLPWQSGDDLKGVRSAVASLAETGALPSLRRAAWAGLAVADDGFDAVYSKASKSPATLAELLEGVPLILDSELRAKAQSRVQPLLGDWPADIRTAVGNQKGTSGRFVRIELPRAGTLTLAEVQVFSGGANIAPQGKARQSSTSNSGDASRAIDGRTDGEFGKGSQTHSSEGEANPWWEVDLGSERSVESVTIWNRTDADLGSRLNGYTLAVLDGSRREIFRKAGNPAPSPSASLTLGSDAGGNLRRAAIRAAVSLPRDPATTFAALSGLITKGEQVPSAAAGIRVLPADSWPKTTAGNTAKSLVTWAKTVAEGNRTSRDYVETVQLASDLAGQLPPDEATALRRELRSLRVPVYVIHTVREQMRYDTARIVVEAGKAFEIIVENGDFMPHNLVVVAPGQRERIGTAAALLPPGELDRRGRSYIPKSDGILEATKLLNAGQSETLKVAAINKEGDYEYVCTFPGHHQVMWGWLIVTKDVDAYLAANPEVRAAGAGHEHPEKK